jgi:hypothetical protein
LNNLKFNFKAQGSMFKIEVLNENLWVATIDTVTTYLQNKISYTVKEVME